jgi:hypothetical protein
MLDRRERGQRRIDRLDDDLGIAGATLVPAGTERQVAGRAVTQENRPERLKPGHLAVLLLLPRCRSAFEQHQPRDAGDYGVGVEDRVD